MSNKSFYGYRIVTASSGIQLLFLGGVFTYGVLFRHLEAEFGWLPGNPHPLPVAALISGAGSLMFFFMGSLSALMGFLSDRLGPRMVMTFTAALFGTGFFLISTITAPWQLYLYYGLLCGIGMSAHDVVLLSTVARWFTTYRGLMAGIVKTGAGIGQVLVPVAAAYLIAIYNWRDAVLIIGIVLLIGMLLMSQLLRRDPRAYGQLPLGEEQTADDSTPSIETGATVRQAIGHYQFWLLCFAKLADFYCVTTIMVHIVRYGQIEGLSPAVAALLIACVGGFSIIGRLAFGVLFDRIGTRLSLNICFSLLLFSFILLQQIERPELLFVFTFFYGIPHGGFFVIASPSVAEYFGTRSHGSILGLVFFIGTLGAVGGPLMTGWTFDVTQNYDMSIMILIALGLLGLCLTLFLRPIKPNWATLQPQSITAPPVNT